MKRLFVLCALAACLAGCGQKSHEPASKLTEAQRDTALSRSDLPGSAAVGRAFEVSGKAANHALVLDSLGVR